MSFYWFIPSGGAEPPAGDELMLARSPFKISTDTTSADGSIEIFIGDEVNITCQMVDADGNAINCDGDTMSSLVTDSTGATAVTPSVAAQWDDAGWFILSFAAPSTAGNYRLTLRRNGGSGDISTAGPLIIRVLAR